ncbi:MAG TPA: hypothetical protein PLQ44_01710 [Candidatus Paceibacterota bacterium]|nr:hypothetical protein [Candidatus Paceibacterota bacterium]HPT40302.1 hypothetical protein [Candidatus Paceibacterota bacterium]
MSVEKKNGGILVIGDIFEEFLNALKEVFCEYDVEVLDPSKCSEDFLLNFIMDRFQPVVIFLSEDTYSQVPVFYDRLKTQLSSVCFRVIYKVEFNRERSEYVGKFLENMKMGIMEDLQKNKE